MPPPLPELPSDREHLNVLAILHFTMGVVTLGMLVALLLFVNTFYSLFLPQMHLDPKADTRALVSKLLVLYQVLFGIYYGVSCALNVTSGFCLWKRKARLFSLVVAGINCLQIPIGTGIGVFTFIVLMRDSVRGIYARASSPGPAEA